MKKQPKIIVITGAESTGKSTLAEWLGKHFDAPVIPEFARDYIEQLNQPYNINDVEIIARKQVDELNAAKKQKHPVVFVDTWLLITKIWFEMKYQQVPAWLENEIRSATIDLFLICDIDLPWIPDPVRENGGEKRRILQNIYIENIKKYNFAYQIVNGKNQTRFEKALHAVQLLMKK